MQISDIDSNFRIETKLDLKDVQWHDPCKEPFRLYGVTAPNPDEGDVYRRCPKAIADNTNDGVAFLATCTAGGRVRFTTDSPYVALHAILPERRTFVHMAPTGTSGFALYVYEGGEQHYSGTYMPNEKEFEGVYYLGDRRKRDCVIYMPLYNDVSRFYIGLSEGSTIELSPEYTIAKPVVYYGSSITQGGCASKPSSDYISLVSRALDCNYINLGFSGSGKGEQIMADYIASLDMSAFVLDYDHNAPNVEHLEKTHYPFYKTVRDAHPDVPIIMMSRPDNAYSGDSVARLGVIMDTYRRAVKEGDKNVFVIDGGTFYGDAPRCDASVDGCHPTDLGFYFMAKTLTPILARALHLR